MPSRTPKKLPQNDKAIRFILRREVLGISHFKFQLNQAYLYLCSPKTENLHAVIV